MNNWGIEHNLVKAGGRRIVQDFRKRGLNPQDLKTIRRTQGCAFQLEVYTSRISPPRAEINLLDLPQERLITQRENP
jgi:hypothetical protein